jgi:hypothetical protein
MAGITFDDGGHPLTQRHMAAALSPKGARVGNPLSARPLGGKGPGGEGGIQNRDDQVFRGTPH